MKKFLFLMWMVLCFAFQSNAQSATSVTARSSDEGAGVYIVSISDMNPETIKILEEIQLNYSGEAKVAPIFSEVTFDPTKAALQDVRVVVAGDPANVNTYNKESVQSFFVEYIKYKQNAVLDVKTTSSNLNTH